MGNKTLEGPSLFGVIEVDETTVGGKTKGKRRGNGGNKTSVAGAIQRGGGIRLEAIPDTRQGTLHDFVRRTANAIYTDDWPAYRGIGDEDTRHETVNHPAEEWVLGNVLTNSIESV